MNNDEWLAFRDALPPQHKVLADALMQRLSTIITDHENRQLDQIQRLERRMSELHALFDALRDAPPVEPLP